jgi:DNA polymerase beta
MSIKITKSSASKQFMLAQEFSSDKANLSKKAQGKYDSVQPPVGWYAEEKYDGYRARYHPEEQRFYSRSGHNFPPKGNVPMWILAAMPYVHLDGELYRGRGAEAFQKMGEIKRHNPSPQAWQGVKYLVYDLPEFNAPYSERKDELIKVVQQCKEQWADTLKSLECPRWMKNLPCPIEVSPHIIIKSQKQLDTYMDRTIKAKGEGLMLKDPNALYEGKRSPYLLKMKALYDDEAIIVGYEPGQGKYKGMLGSFICSPLLPEKDGQRQINQEYTFTMSGMDDKIRKTYKKSHPIGTVITFLFNDRTASGRPRHPRYQRTRDDTVINKSPVVESGEDRTLLVLDILRKISNYEKSKKGGAFKAKNYNKAIESIEGEGSITDYDLKDLLALNGIGKSIGEKIQQILTLGTCDYYESFKDKSNYLEIFGTVQGIGPVKAAELVDAGLTSIEELKENPDMLNDKQKMGLMYYDDLQKRIPRHECMKHEKVLMDTLAEVSNDTAKGLVTGSYRRGVSNSGDIDFLIKIPGNDKKIFKKLIEALTDKKYLKDHLAFGATKYNGVCKLGPARSHRRVDIMFCTEEEFPFAVFYFTGSAGFNVAFRSMALEKGYTLNEHCLTDIKSKKKVTNKFKEELDIFDFFKVKWVEPVDRTSNAIKSS